MLREDTASGESRAQATRSCVSAQDKVGAGTLCCAKTAYIGDDGELHFAPDVYHRDDALDHAMRTTPPRS
jgi:hypothetical protein